MIFKITRKSLASVAVASLLSLFSLPVFADEEAPKESLDDLSFVEMVNSVELGKQSALVQKFQDKEARSRLLNGKYNPKNGSGCVVETFRNKEVLLITVPARLLFSPNSTELKQGASEYLNPLKRYMKDPEMFRVLLVMHTDNTGSEQYRDMLTVDRVEAVYDWFDNAGCDTRSLFTYPLGDEMPLVPNTSVQNRDRNRRLEVYLVPGPKMLEQAKKGRIEF